MNYSFSNKKIKSGIFNKVTMALCQNNLLTNLFHTTRHSERRCYARRHIRFAFTRHPEALAVSMSNNNRRAAFTLAEVLITLGIIGVVAALTIPTLISNYNKRQTVTKLKQTYSILSQALTMAQVKEGDTSTWDVAGIFGTPTDDPNFNREESIEKFVDKYLIPYVKVSKNYGVSNASNIGYDAYYAPSGNHYSAYTRGHYFLLSNNVLVMTSIATSGCVGGTNPDGSCVSTEFRNIVFYVDINGLNKPNTVGKDVFLMQFDIPSKQFGFHQYTNNNSRDSYKSICATDSGSQVCGYLIYLDGWQIRDDYPWL